MECDGRLGGSTPKSTSNHNGVVVPDCHSCGHRFQHVTDGGKVIMRCLVQLTFLLQASQRLNNGLAVPRAGSKNGTRMLAQGELAVGVTGQVALLQNGLVVRTRSRAHSGDPVAMLQHAHASARNLMASGNQPLCQWCFRLGPS